MQLQAEPLAQLELLEVIALVRKTQTSDIAVQLQVRLPPSYDTLGYMQTNNHVNLKHGQTCQSKDLLKPKS